MKTIYLAGAMDGLTHNEATIWRRYARRVLTEAGYKVISPTDGKDLDRPDENTTRYTPRQIVEADLDAVRSADIILAEVSRSDRPYIGTAMEIRQAYIWGKEIVAWGGSESYWIRYHATRSFRLLAEALGYLVDIDSKGNNP